MNQPNMFLIISNTPADCKNQHSHDDRSHIPDHKGIHFFALKGMSAGFHFLADPRRPDDPAYKDAGEEGNEWHEKAVADIVHDV